jgi:transcriptional regulator GlxA family with amidase domain
MPIRVIIVLFDRVQGLDVFGPAEVLAAADRLLGGKGYQLVFGSTRGGPCATSSGANVGTRPLRSIRVRRGDTVIVAGGDEGPVDAAAADRALLAWLGGAERVAHRFGSVCTGAFILGTIGVLDGKRCATHWSACDRLAERFPSAQVQRDAIFVADGKLWTSAGITAGIDMTLAMVEEDHGSKIADAIAAQAVLYARRPGFQSQFSEALVAQVAKSDPLGPSISWARSHLAELSVEALARHAGLAVRTLHRRTDAVLGVTPAKLIERLRVEHARTLLSSTALPQKVVAGQAGFSGGAQMQRALKRHLGVDGGAVRLLFGSGSRPRRAAARAGMTSTPTSLRRAQA